MTKILRQKFTYLKNEKSFQKRRDGDFKSCQVVTSNKSSLLKKVIIFFVLLK